MSVELILIICFLLAFILFTILVFAYCIGGLEDPNKAHMKSLSFNIKFNMFRCRIGSQLLFVETEEELKELIKSNVSPEENSELYFKMICSEWWTYRRKIERSERQ